MLAELSKETFIKIQSDQWCFPVFAFFFFLFFEAIVLKYIGLIYITGQEQVSLFRFIQISMLFCYCSLLVFIL